MRKNRGIFLASALLLAVSSGTIGQGMSVFAAKESAVKQMEESFLLVTEMRVSQSKGRKDSL